MKEGSSRHSSSDLSAGMGAGTPHDTLDERAVCAEVARRMFGEVDPGAAVAGYRIIEAIGAGSFGVVYRAHDSKLDRIVALKLLRSRIGLSTDGLDEARAMAKVAHPNVVHVYEAGIVDGRAYVVMELVEGLTLRAWLAARPCSWLDVLRLFVDAGSGLAAAHAQGVVHGDFKPDNVLVSATDDMPGRPGPRARVTDFGLARLEVESPTSRDVVTGTPAYMAPEQARDGVSDTRSDQYAFCVSLWEALFGVRPFTNADRIDPSARPRPPRGKRVPTWLRNVVLRGLRHEPKDRFASMDALVQALISGRTRSARRRVLGTCAVVGSVALLGVTWQRWDENTRVAACEREGERIEEIWNEEVRNGLRLAFIGTQMRGADETADQVMPWLDAQAAAWQRAREEACLATDVHGTWTEDVLERSTWCLEERRMELEALVKELLVGGQEAVEAAVEAVADLAPVAPCGHVDLLASLPSPPKTQEEQIRGVRAEISRARALRRLGAFADAASVAREAVERAEALGWPPLIAAARLILGKSLERAGAYAQAEAALERAYFVAAKAGAPDVAVDAAVALVFTVTDGFERHADALRWSEHAEVILESLPDPTQMRLAAHLENLGTVYRAKGAYAEANPDLAFAHRYSAKV